MKFGSSREATTLGAACCFSSFEVTPAYPDSDGYSAFGCWVVYDRRTCFHARRSPGWSMNNVLRAMRLRTVETGKVVVFFVCGLAAIFGSIPSDGPVRVHAQETAEISDEQRTFFEQKIRPVLVQHCYSCHSAEAEKSKKLQGGLYLDSAAAVLAGGDSGPGLVPHKPAESLLLKALKYDGLEMPPAGKLGDEIVADFAKWIELGAPDPRRGERAGKPKREIDVNAGRQWWSFQPLSQPAPPDIADASLDPIDRFLVAAQRAAGIKPNVPATKEKWIRQIGRAHV